MSRRLSPFVILTGIPRSGTTLLASLVDQLADSLCLNEPPRYYDWTQGCDSASSFVKKTFDDLHAISNRLTSGLDILDRRTNTGNIPTNYFDTAGRRLPLQLVSLRRALSGTLLLAVKHNEPLTSVLSHICDRTDARVIAIVRDPIPTILSWMSRPIPLSRGELSSGYRFWPAARIIQRDSRSPEEFHARMYEVYCARYWDLRDRVEVIRYEDLVADCGIVEAMTGRRFQRIQTAYNANHERLTGFPNDRLLRLTNALAEHLDCALKFYPRSDAFGVTT